jgi:choline dehydrogenase-like flavoprotein
MGALPDFQPAFSPDGTRLAFLRRTEGRLKVMVMPSGGGSAHQCGEIVDLLREYALMTWDATGQNLFVTDRVSESRPEIALFEISVETGARRQVTFPPEGAGDWMPAVSPEVASRFGAPPPDAFTIAPALVQPTSTGSVRLASNNFQDAAVIDGNYLGTDRDFAAIVRAIEAAREIGRQHAFDSVRGSELIPGPKASAEEIRELARLASASFGHAVGTCKMGVDKLAVVDPELRVHGIERLRVADASVMPRIPTGPGTNASAHMIAGRAGKLILG